MAYILGLSILIPLAVAVFLAPSLSYLRRHRSVSDLLWGLSPTHQEWWLFSRATNADWTSLGVLSLNAWRPSVWRRLNPDLYVQ